jgi:crotonobetainyl-CoA:carnitine CoA-transferase CaiB-like acyl-CoA transferase
VPELVTDPRFKDNPTRVAHRGELKDLLGPVLLDRTTAEWIALLEPLGVPCGPINRLDQVFADPQVQHRGMRIELEHPVAGRLPLVANPIRLSRTPIRYEAPPPLLGQHTGEVLRGLLGKSAAEIEILRGDAVI